MSSGALACLLVLSALLLAAPLAAQEEPASAPSPEETAAGPGDLRLDGASPGKSARGAMAASALFPGLGQLYNEEGLKTLLVFAWESYYISIILREGQQADLYRRRAAALGPGETWRGLDQAALRSRFHRHEDREVDYIWYSSALFIASVLDAYVFANLYSHNTDDIRRPRAGIRPLIDPGAGSVGLALSWRF